MLEKAVQTGSREARLSIHPHHECYTSSASQPSLASTSSNIRRPSNKEPRSSAVCSSKTTTNTIPALLPGISARCPYETPCNAKCGSPLARPSIVVAKCCVQVLQPIVLRPRPRLSSLSEQSLICYADLSIISPAGLAAFDPVAFFHDGLLPDLLYGPNKT